MDRLLAQLVSGLTSATLLFLLASGFSLIFGVSRVLNLAHGALFVLAGYLAFTVSLATATSPLRFWIMLILVPAGMLVVGLAIERWLLRRIYPAGIDAQVLLTVGLIYVIDDVVRLIWGTGYKSVHTPEEFAGRISIAGNQIAAYQLIVGRSAFWSPRFYSLSIPLGHVDPAAAEDRRWRRLGSMSCFFALVFGLGCGLVGLAAVLAHLLTVDVALGTGNCRPWSSWSSAAPHFGCHCRAVLIGMIKAYGILIAHN
jgi:branched-subunit amino acid ABC-type transport system permease component